MTDGIGLSSIAASERLARRIEPCVSTTAIPSLKASNAVSHCSFAWWTISKKRAFAITMAACVATVDSSRTSSGVNTASRGSAITSVPTSTPWARSGTAAAAATGIPAMSGVGSPSVLCTSSTRSPVTERAISPGSSGPIDPPRNGPSVPSAAVTLSRRRSASSPPSASPSAASATRAPFASRNRMA